MAALLAQRESEGLTYAELAEQAGLAKSTVAWWSWRLRRDAREAFAEVVVDDEHDAPARDDRIAIAHRDLTITVPQGFDAETLSRVLDVVFQRC